MLSKIERDEKAARNEGHVECGLTDLDGVPTIANSGLQSNCPISKPTKWPPILQMPVLDDRDPNIIGTTLFVCKSKDPCLTVLVTSENRTLGESTTLYLSHLIYI